MSNNIKFNFFFLIIISTIYILLIFQIIKQQILYPLCKNYIKIVRTECYKIMYFTYNKQIKCNKL